MNENTITRTHTLAELAVRQPGASRVFHRHGLDFCCHGQVTLEAACAPKQLAVEALIAELEEEQRRGSGFRDWSAEPLPALIDHVLVQYHEPHRAEVDRLHAMAERVERVHADKAQCPHGLADLIGRVRIELEAHMGKEEQILFPAIRAGRGRLVAGAVRVMEQEHEDHGRNLAALRALTGDFEPPAEACNTWRALYLGLAELEREVMQHIHLENNVLFPRALREEGSRS